MPTINQLVRKPRAKAAKKRAEERLQKKDAGLDTARAEAALKRAMARISAAR